MLLETPDAKKELSNIIGKICSINCSSQTISYILKLLSKSKVGSNISTLIEALINMILGDSINYFYYFNGDTESYIKINNLSALSDGYMMVATVYVENLDSSNEQIGRAHV